MNRQHQTLCTTLLLTLAAAGCGQDPSVSGVVNGFGEIEVTSRAASIVTRPDGTLASFDPGFSVSALYYRGSPPNPDCTRETIAQCTVYSCVGSSPEGWAGDVMPVLAGSVTVAGGQRRVELVPGPEGAYPAVTSDTEGLFAGGEELSFTATGEGSIPAHAASVQAPYPVALTQPDTSRVVQASASQDLAFTWTAAPYGNLVLTLSVKDPSGDDSGTAVTTRCELDGTRGTGAIPATALGRSPRTATGEPAVLSVRLDSSTDLQAGGWEVTFLAGSLTQALIALE
jgi:hypothetical protein